MKSRKKTVIILCCVFCLIAALVIGLYFAFASRSSATSTPKTTRTINDITIIVCFLVRNGEDYLTANIKKLIHYFDINSIKWKMIYIENDSNDNTRKILNKFEKIYTSSFIGEQLNLDIPHSVKLCKKGEEYNCRKRTTFLGKLRQKSLDIALEYQSDAILMMDMDFVSFEFGELSEMIELWKVHDADAIFGMSKTKDNKLYDTGAVVPEKSLRKIRTSSNIVYVKSAFSGFGLYRTSSIRKYSARYDLNSGEIEHIPFNLHFDKVLVYPLFNPIYELK